MKVRSKTPLFLSLGPIMITHTCQGLLTTLPYVVGVYMVRDFLSVGGVAPSEERVGSLTGLLGACFCAAQLITSYPLGMLSDRLGRRPIIIFGNASCVITTCAFGLAGSYRQAVAARLAGGLLNAIIGAEKAIIGETLDTADQAKAMGYISLTWGIGSLLGPTIGGFLSQPCSPTGVFHSKHDGLCAPDSLMQKRPYFLPCLVAAAITLIATLLTAFFLEESLPNRTRSNGKQGYAAVPVSGDDDNGILGSHHQDRDLSEVELAPMGMSPRPRHTVGKLQAEDSLYELALGTTEEEARRLPVDAQHREILPWYKQRNVILALCGYSLIAFCFILIDELTPIFASASIAQGGLGFPTSELAPPLAFGGIVLFFWALWGYPWLMARLGVVRACRYGLLQTAPMALLIPASSFAVFPSHANVAMWLAMGLKSISGTNAFTSCIILVNSVSPKESLGAVNGAGQTMASAVRALGPALGGLSWAWSLKLFRALGLPLWGHQFLPFGFAACVALCTLMVYRIDIQPTDMVVERSRHWEEGGGEEGGVKP